MHILLCLICYLIFNVFNRQCCIYLFYILCTKVVRSFCTSDVRFLFGLLSGVKEKQRNIETKRHRDLSARKKSAKNELNEISMISSLNGKKIICMNSELIKSDMRKRYTQRGNKEWR